MLMYKYKALEKTKLNFFVRRYLFITLAIIIVIIGILCLPWQQTIKGVGTLTALNPNERNYKVVSTLDGFMEALYVKENQFVKKGDKLFTLRDLDENYQYKLLNIEQEYSNRLRNEQSRHMNLNNNLNQEKKNIKIKKEVYDTKISQLKNRLKALKEQKKALKNQFEIEEIQLHRVERLFYEGIESKRTLELKKFNTLQIKAKVEKVVVDIENIYNDLIITRKEKAHFINESERALNNIQNKILTVENSVNKLKQDTDKNSIKISRYRSRDIVAKSDGYVMRIYQSDSNRLMKKGDEILYFAPKVSERTILLKVPIFNMPLMKEGLRVRIMFYGWPTFHISGWPEISHGTYEGIVKSIEHTSHIKGFYYALVVEDSTQPWPDKKLLRIGTESTLWVRLKKVTIWYELWRLFAAQPPKMHHIYEEEL